MLALLSASTLAVSNAGVDIFTSGQEGYACYRIPAFLRLPKGELAVYAEGRKFSCADHGWNDIVFKTSTNGGATWGPLQLLFSNSTTAKHVTIGNPSPVVVGGEVLMVFCRNNREVLLLRSPDGLLWTGLPSQITPATLSNVSWVATGPPQGLLLPAGSGSESDRILIQANYIGPGIADAGFVLISDDAGSSWRRSTATVPGCNEGQVAPAPNGSLLMNCRTTGWHRLLSWSHDRGETWSPPHSLYLGQAGSNSPCEGSTVLANSATLLFSHNFGVAGANGCGRCNMTVWASHDGNTWKDILQVDSEPQTGGEYSALLAFNATHSLLVYERGSYATLALRTITLPVSL